MKKMIDESIHRPYTLTEGLLCFATGLLVISTYGLPTFTRLGVLVVAIICTILTNTAAYLENDFTAKRNDASLFLIIAIISFVVAAIMGENITVGLFRAAGVLGFVYTGYCIMTAFTSEPPDNMRRIKKGMIIGLLSPLLFALPNIIEL